MYQYMEVSDLRNFSRTHLHLEMFNPTPTAQISEELL